MNVFAKYSNTGKIKHKPCKSRPNVSVADSWCRVLWFWLDIYLVLDPYIFIWVQGYLKLNHLSSVEHYNKTSHWKLKRIQNMCNETYGELIKMTKWIYIENAENNVTGVLDKNSSDKAHYSNTGYKLQNPWAIKNSWRVYRTHFHVAY